MRINLTEIIRWGRVGLEEAGLLEKENEVENGLPSAAGDEGDGDKGAGDVGDEGGDSVIEREGANGVGEGGDGEGGNEAPSSYIIDYWYYYHSARDRRSIKSCL